MSNQSNQATKKGMILLMGIIIGLITGFVVSFILLKKLDIIPNSDSASPQITEEIFTAPDTVVKYVVHRYESDYQSNKTQQSDSVNAVDSSFFDMQNANYKLEDEDEQGREIFDNNLSAISEAKLISKFETPVYQLSDEKKLNESPENVVKNIEIQVWSTPIKNKISYIFDGKLLKIKGLQHSEHITPFVFEDKYFIKVNNKIYRIQTTKDYLRLTETHDFNL